jgi:hypothetical protein
MSTVKWPPESPRHFVPLTNDAVCNIASCGGEQLRMCWHGPLKVNDRTARRERPPPLEAHLLARLSEYPDLIFDNGEIKSCLPINHNQQSRC